MQEMYIPITALVSILSVTFAIYFGLKNNKRCDTKDIEERVKDNTKIMTTLQVINQTTADIKNEVFAVKNNVQSIDKRLVVVEESVKSAHHRIDSLEKRVDKEME